MTHARIGDLVEIKNFNHPKLGMLERSTATVIGKDDQGIAKVRYEDGTKSGFDWHVTNLRVLPKPRG